MADKVPEKPPAFQWYPKDCLTDPVVVAMSPEAECAYRRLIDYCWLEESLAFDLLALARMAKARSKKQMERLWEEMKSKFVIIDDPQRGARIRHKRLDEERQKQADSRARRQKAADERWAKERALQEQNKCNADAMQCSPSSSSSSTPVNKKESAADAARAFVDAWNTETAHPVAQCRELTAKRQKAITKRLSERPLSEWVEVFTRIGDSDFCRGGNDRGWVASIDWVLQPDTAAKVLEGKYDNRHGADPALARKFGPVYGREPSWQDDCQARHDGACIPEGKGRHIIRCERERLKVGAA